jgi:hypothetical protein
VNLAVRLYHVALRPDTEGWVDHVRCETGPWLERLLALPVSVGLAPWLRCRFLPERHSLLLVRRYYDTKLVDAFPPARTAAPGGAPCPEFLNALGEVARGIDALYAHCGDVFRCPVYVNDLFLDGSRVVLADYGLEELNGWLFRAHNGPFLREIEHWLMGGFASPPSARPDSGVAAVALALAPAPVDSGAVLMVAEQHCGGTLYQKAQFALAYAYFQLRVGRALFCSPSAVFPPNLPDSERGRQQAMVYVQTGRLDLSPLTDAREQEALAQALAVDPARRFPSCRAFIAALR